MLAHQCCCFGLRHSEKHEACKPLLLNMANEHHAGGGLLAMFRAVQVASESNVLSPDRPDTLSFTKGFGNGWTAQEEDLFPSHHDGGGLSGP